MLELTPRHLRHLVQQSRRGLALGLKPELVMDGSGGTYILHDARKVNIGVFKPADEEPYAENNPRGYVRQSGNSSFSALREGIDPGEACLREVAAYLLDHGGFSDVPMTTLVEARHPAFNTNGSRLNVSQGGASLGSHSLLGDNQPRTHKKKVGSFQAFVNSECTMDDLSPSKLSKDEVHKIAVLDIRLMNADRNSANLLCQRRENNSLRLIPIDHGFCLRSVCDVSWMDWCWLDWPQLKQPLSKKTRDYVLKLDIDADVRMLKESLNIQGAAIDYFRASSKMLIEGVKAGLTLYEIATLCCRNDDMGAIPSRLEVMTEIASELSTLAAGNGRWHHSTASRAIAEQLSPSPEAKSSFSTLRIIKSASSVNFHSLGHNDSVDIPGMAQSSASDASSDVGDAVTDRDECEEWAAAVVADVSMDKRLMATAAEDNESSSDDTVLSSSPKGFWFTKPGEHDSDDESVTWSPHVSPMSSMELSKEAGLLPKEEGLFLPDVKAFKSSSSLLTESLDGSFLLPPPATIDTSLVNVPQAIRRSSSNMSRSQSYSVFRTRSISNSSSNLSNTQLNCNWRSYFHKFVNLVVSREIAAAAQSTTAA